MGEKESWSEEETKERGGRQNGLQHSRSSAEALVVQRGQMDLKTP